MPAKAQPYRPQHTPQTATGARTDDRRPAHLRGYDRAWTRLRNTYLAQHPLCEWCEARDLIAAQDLIVDHKTPVDVAPSRRLDPTNLQTLCRSCHAIKTNADKRIYSPPAFSGPERRPPSPELEAWRAGNPPLSPQES